MSALLDNLKSRLPGIKTQVDTNIKSVYKDGNGTTIINERPQNISRNPKEEEIKDNSKEETKDTDSSNDTNSETGAGSQGFSVEDYTNLMNSVKTSNLGTKTTAPHDLYTKNSETFMTGIGDFLTWMKTNANTAFAEASGNPLETEWGKSILDYYGLLGDQSANAVNAATAGENAGNIDSYAAANAERQRLSKLGQGISAVSGMSTDRVNNMLSVLNSIGVNTNELFGTMGEYGVNTAADYAGSLYATDAGLASSLFGTGADFAATKYATDAQSTADLEANLAALYSGGDPEYIMPSIDDLAVMLQGYYDSYGGDGKNYDDEEIWEQVMKVMMSDQRFASLPPLYYQTAKNTIISKDKQ